MRFYDLEKNNGKIKLNNTDITFLDKVHLRELITYVPQEPHTFTGKVIDNLTMGAKTGTTFDDVLKSTEIAHIRTDIENMSQGFETEISELGNLSGGQMQRLSLARALLTDSKVIILDESTSNLDVLTEKIVVDNLMNLTDKTIIFVAHRLTIAERVPRLVMLEHGQIVADGTHNDLLGSNDAYTNLVRK
ncbi:abc-transporter plng (bacteriocin abc transporter) [Weissella minor]|uniref:Abc-transporter plng (Bacteriocin abc transporter) n=1 Tax=Weissella minor TaxID=1620 RepID=A0A0R2JLR6_9LACO|nr:abc-transporter plng (bacteriocin abc transporter) [Weissella minor]